MVMRETFEDYIGLSPQTRIDIDDVVRRSRRILRRRQSVAACVTGLTVLGVAVLSVAVPPGGGSQSSPSTAVSPASPRPQAGEPDRLLAALKAAIAHAAPQVRGVDKLDRYVLQCVKGAVLLWDYVPADEGVNPLPCPTPSGKPLTNHNDLARQYVWRGQLTSPTGTYVVHINIAPTVYHDPAAPPVNATDADERRIAREQGDAPERGPNGENIRVTNYLLNMSKPDGTNILIKAWDTNKKGAYLTRSPFTAKQLTAIGLDPALHL
jgi:hypothetical protein